MQSWKWWELITIHQVLWSHVATCTWYLLSIFIEQACFWSSQLKSKIWHLEQQHDNYSGIKITDWIFIFFPLGHIILSILGSNHSLFGKDNKVALVLSLVSTFTFYTGGKDTFWVKDSAEILSFTRYQWNVGKYWKYQNHFKQMQQKVLQQEDPITTLSSNTG